MSQSRPAGGRGAPKLEELVAYVDGQLDPARRKDVETWLRDHPQAAAEIEGQNGLAGLWQATTAAEPDEARWANLLERVECAYARFRSAQSPSRRILPIVAAGLAAGLLLALWTPHRPGPIHPPAAGEPLVVVSPDEVEIVSLRAADRDTLVVGVPPVTGPLVLASLDDVELEAVEPDTDGMIPDFHRDEQSATPMIVAPLDPVPAEAPGREGGTSR